MDIENGNRFEAYDPAVNLQNLIQFSGNCMDTVRSIIQVFLEESPAQMEHLIALVAQDDWSRVMTLSHKMKSSYAIIGANSVRTLLHTIEELCKESTVNASQVKTLMSQVIIFHEEVIKRITADQIYE